MNRDRNIQLTGDMAKKRAFAFIAFHQMHPPKPNNRENQTRKPSPTAEIEQSITGLGQMRIQLSGIKDVTPPNIRKTGRTYQVDMGLPSGEVSYIYAEFFACFT